MRIWVLLFLTVVSVQGFPQKKSAEKQPTARNPNLAQRNQIFSGAGSAVKGLQSTEEAARQTGRIPLLTQRLAKATKYQERDCKAKCVSNIAQKAAAEAKAAQAAQNAAGAQAAHMVKTQLAEKALQAAKAAEAALAGKQAVVEQLQQEVKEAEAVVAENTAAVHQQQGTVNVAIQAAQQSAAMHKLMCQATQLAATVAKTVNCVLEKTKFGLQEKCHNLAEARARLAQLQHKLQCACAECAATRQAAHCACEAARTACGNARRRKRLIHNSRKRKTAKRRRRTKILR